MIFFFSIVSKKDIENKYKQMRRNYTLKDLPDETEKLVLSYLYGATIIIDMNGKKTQYINDYTKKMNKCVYGDAQSTITTLKDLIITLKYYGEKSTIIEIGAEPFWIIKRRYASKKYASAEPFCITKKICTFDNSYLDCIDINNIDRTRYGEYTIKNIEKEVFSNKFQIKYIPPIFYSKSRAVKYTKFSKNSFKKKFR